MDIPKKFVTQLIDDKFEIVPFITRGPVNVLRYRVTIRTWSPPGNKSYVMTPSELVKLRDWINSAIIAEHSRTTRGSDER